MKTLLTPEKQGFWHVPSSSAANYSPLGLCSTDSIFIERAGVKVLGLLYQFVIPSKAPPGDTLDSNFSKETKRGTVSSQTFELQFEGPNDIYS